MKQRGYLKERVSKYSRIFTDLLPKGFGREIQSLMKTPIRNKKFQTKLIQFAFVYLSIVILALSYITMNLFKTYQAAKSQREQEDKQLQYWEDVLRKQPNYPDAYYKAALNAARLGEANKAFEYVDKALFYDPNFKEAEKLKEELLRLR